MQVPKKDDVSDRTLYRQLDDRRRVPLHTQPHRFLRLSGQQMQRIDTLRLGYQGSESIQVRAKAMFFIHPQGHELLGIDACLQSIKAFPSGNAHPTSSFPNTSSSSISRSKTDREEGSRSLTASSS